MTLYSGESVFAYTFGAYAFGTETVCQVATGSSAPSMTMSTGVSECTVSGSVVTVKMAASSVDFFVVVNRAAKWDSTGSHKITANLKNYGSEVQTTDTDTAK